MTLHYPIGLSSNSRNKLQLLPTNPVNVCGNIKDNIKKALNINTNI